MKSIITFFALTTGEVVAKFAFRTLTVPHELRTECGISNSSGVSYNTRTWGERSIMHIFNLYREKMKHLKKVSFSKLMKLLHIVGITAPVETATPRYTIPVINIARRVPLGIANCGSCNNNPNTDLRL